MSEQNNHNELKVVEELRLINRLIEKISQLRESNHIMSTIITELVKITDADQGIINLLSQLEDKDLVTIVRDKPGSTKNTPFRLNEMISGWVIKNKRLLKIDNIDSEENFDFLTDDHDERFKSLLCFPMIVRGEIIGLTSLVREDKGPFEDDQARLAGIITSQSAQVLSNALLLDELAKKNELLKLSQQKLKEENLRLKREVSTQYVFENIVGKSAAIKDVITLTSKVSNLDSPVIITGPTGTGKELIARAIHYNSRRNEKPFVIKNCGVKTETLLESELFGHVKGAFTGADKNKPGLFKEADGGTIFLDEIGDAPLSTQVAILRVLESGEIRPVGSSKTEFVDVRIISATNKNLKEQISKDLFREDLFYRLNTFNIEMPPLKHRIDDIPLLVHYFIKKLKIKLDIDNLSISPAALNFLAKYSWPGNVRQLENEIERAALICEGGLIDLADLSPELLDSASSSADFKKYQGKLRDIIDKVETDIINTTLQKNKGNILKSSQELGLTRKGLKDKMERLNIILDRDE